MFYMFPEEEIKEIEVWWTGWPGHRALTSCPSPSVASLKVISGGVTEVRWDNTMHEPHVSSNIKRGSLCSYSGKVSSKIVSLQFQWVYEAKDVGLQKSPQKYQPKC
jgi:hypothetical protein